METLRILVIEDEIADFLLLERHLSEQRLAARCLRVDSADALAAALGEEEWDVVLSDYSVPGMTFRDSLALIRARAPELPVILVSGSVGEDEAAELLKIGLADFVLKDRLARLVPAIRRALLEAAERRARDEAERALRDSEERHRSLFENMLEGYAYCRMVYEDARPTDFVYLHVNESFERLTGLKRVVGRRVTELIPGIQDSNPELFEIYGRVAATGRPERFEDYVEPLRTWFSVSVYRPEPGCFVSVFDNITDRKVHEREIERLNQLYSTLSGISQAIVRVKGREELFREVCRITAEHTGFRVVWIGWLDPETRAVLPVARAGASEKYLDGIQVTADDRPEGRGPVGTCIREGKPTIFNRFLTDPRAAPWREAARKFGIGAVAALPIRCEGKVCGAFTVYAGDVDAFQEKEVALLVEAAEAVTFALENLKRDARRREAEDALRDSEERYRRIVETTAEGIWILDADLRTAFVNRAAAEMLGYRPEEMLGRAAESFNFPEDLDEVRRRMGVRREGVPAQYDQRLRRKDGGETWCHVSGTPTFDSSGRFAGAFGMFTDITERRRLEEQLRQSQKMEAIGILAGGVAHDFNNLLTVISGNAELVLARMAADSPLRTQIADIRHAGERAAALTRQLLAFSRKQILEPRVLDLNEVVAGTEKMLRRLIGEDVVLDCILAAPLPCVKVDPGQIEQVVLNLAVNARDAMPQGGRLTIETRRGPEGSVLLSVADTGSGMSPEVSSRIFEPFFTTKDAGRGTGLGLATVYGIVQQSGGRIDVESELGTGTTFRIVLPRAGEAPRGTLSDARLAAVREGRETILVVEDEEPVRRIVKIVLETSGYRVLEARNGEEAVEIVRKSAGPLDLVVTDVVMPGMSGRQLVEQFRTGSPSLKVLFISGYTDDAVMRHGIVDGHESFLQKPFSPTALGKKVREVLDGG